MGLMIWGSADDKNFIICAEDCQAGDPCIVVKTTKGNVLTWIQALCEVANGDETLNLPGEISHMTLATILGKKGAKEIMDQCDELGI